MSEDVRTPPGPRKHLRPQRVKGVNVEYYLLLTVRLYEAYIS